MYGPRGGAHRTPHRPRPTGYRAAAESRKAEKKEPEYARFFVPLCTIGPGSAPGLQRDKTDTR